MQTGCDRFNWQKGVNICHKIRRNTGEVWPGEKSVGRQVCFKLLSYLILWFSISAQDGEGTPVDVQVKDNGNGTYACSYTPRKPVKHTAMVSWGGVNIPDSPFRVSTRGGFCFCINILSGDSFWSCSVFNHRWISEQAVIQTRSRCQDLGWPRPASRPSSQHTSLLIAQRLVKVRLLKAVADQPVQAYWASFSPLFWFHEPPKGFLC